MMRRVYGYGVRDAGDGDGSDSGGASSGATTPREPGSRRRRLAALAGTVAANVYRAGATAVNEIRVSYAQTTVFDDAASLSREGTPGTRSVPGSFPDVEVVARGDEQMILFPCYAKRHVRRFREHARDDDGFDIPPMSAMDSPIMSDEEYWRHEWARHEDETAVADVDVHGWIYLPHRGPITRRNRILIGLARRLCGIPAPDRTTGPGVGSMSSAAGQPEMNSLSARVENHEDLSDQEKIAREAARIELVGRDEEEAAVRGEYSEEPQGDANDVESDTLYPTRTSFGRVGSRTPGSIPGSPVLAAQRLSAAATTANDLTEQELAVANANLMARIAPFMSTPLSHLAVTVFFYNESRSQSRTVTTNDSGHFMLRAPLDFVPTHVRVLVNERLSAVQKIKLIERTGVSLISDIDDTIKHSNISAGAREIFRNTFVRELDTLTVDGVREWYADLHELGVSFHYCSNSPWQLFPVLANFFITAGLPPGSMHLKTYSGMLQGIFEPVAERKKGTLERIMADFPDRQFLLVGDSGEADLEVYTELAIANPGRIIAIFIRDVTTPDAPGFFEAAGVAGAINHSQSQHSTSGQNHHRRRTNVSASSAVTRDDDDDHPASRPALPPRILTEPTDDGKAESGPIMGTLIDLSDEPEELSLDAAGAPDDEVRESQQRPAPPPPRPRPRGPSNSAVELLRGKPAPPPRPVKPVALRSTPSGMTGGASGLGIISMPESPSRETMRQQSQRAEQQQAQAQQRPRNTSGPQVAFASPLAKMQNSSDASTPTLVPFDKGALAKDGSREDSPGSGNNSNSKQPPPVPPPRRRGATQSSLLSLSPRLLASRRSTPSNSDVDNYSLDVQPSTSVPPSVYTRSARGSPISAGHSPPTQPHSQFQSQPHGSPDTFAAVNKKVELWRRRLRRAQKLLDAKDVRLYTWRTGADVREEAVGLVRAALERGNREEIPRDRDAHGGGAGSGGASWR